MTVMWSRNRLQNGDATDGTNHWDDISAVSVVPGGIAGGSCFKFLPTASMSQTVTIAGSPPTARFECKFLPGQDVFSGARTFSEVEVTLEFGDGSEERYIIPVRVFG